MMIDTSAREPSSSVDVGRILIVEDESVVAMDLENSLEELGYSVVGVAESGQKALDLADRHAPDLVIMDIQLRGSMDGIATSHEIKARWGLPVIFVTANTNNEAVARAKASGPYGFLNKPFRPKELDAAVSIALNQYRLAQNLFAERSWFSTTMSSISDGVIATDADGNIRFLNPAAESLTGWSKSEALGRPIEEVYPLSTLDGGRVRECQLRKAISSRESVQKAPFLMRTRDDGFLAVDDAASPILEGGQILGAVTTFVDISDRLRGEQAAAKREERLQEEVDLTSQALGDTREELQALSRHLMSAQEEERRRIARELHDDLGQRVAMLGLKMAALGQTAPDRLAAEARTLQGELSDLATGIREVSHRLHPAAIEDLGLAAALRSLVKEYDTPDLRIGARIEEIPPVPLHVATSLYRIAQESLQNVKKHSPKAPVRISLHAKSGELVLRIEDTGLGFSLVEVRRKGGLGLISMRERARLAGGTLLLTARPNEGTTVLVRVKL